MPGWMRQLSMNVSTSTSLSRMTRPKRYAGSWPSSMNRYKVRGVTPRRCAVSRVLSHTMPDDELMGDNVSHLPRRFGDAPTSPPWTVDVMRPQPACGAVDATKGRNIHRNLSTDKTFSRWER